MNVDRSSLCNCVVNFLLEENYVLTAFELLHELLDDGHDDQAIRLKQYFSDQSLFPADQISRLNSLRVADPQSLFEEKEAATEKLAISDYELRLAQEDISKLKSELQKKTENSNEQSATQLSGDVSVNDGQQIQQQKNTSFTDLGPLKDTERQDLNCAVKEYLLLAGYRLTAMTFYEEVTDQNLDIWHNTPASVPDALRHYYYQYLSSTSEAAEEKFSLLQENEKLLKSNKKLNQEKETLLKNKDLADAQIGTLTKSLEAMQKDIRDKENQVLVLKQSLEHQRKELNDCRAEITSLKMHIEGSFSGNNLAGKEVNNVQSQSLEKYEEEIKKLQVEIESLKEKNARAHEPGNFVSSEMENLQTDDKVIEIHEDQGTISNPGDAVVGAVHNEDAQSSAVQPLNENANNHEDTLLKLVNPANTNSAFENIKNDSEQNFGQQEVDTGDRKSVV